MVTTTQSSKVVLTDMDLLCSNSTTASPNQLKTFEWVRPIPESNYSGCDNVIVSGALTGDKVYFVEAKSFNMGNLLRSRQGFCGTLENRLLLNTISKFSNDIVRRKHLVAGNISSATYFFMSTLAKIDTLTPSNIIVGLTNSSSIYFRFYNFPLYETHLEVFYTKDDEDDNIEAVATVYQKDEEVLKKYGTLNSVFQAISNQVKKSTTCKAEAFELYGVSL